jgi:sugar lactone lactonase YvrE
MLATMSLPRVLIASTAAAGLVLTGAGAASAASAPTEIPLPTGFQPEGIDVGPGRVAYLGSLADGSIFRADLRTGEGEVFSAPTGAPSVGLEIDDRGRLFVAGGPSGTARVVDAVTGEELAGYALADAAAGAFVNDVVVTDEAAYFTDSANPVLYRLPLGRFGELPAAEDVERLPLTGDLAYDDDPATFEANGIETTPDGSALLVVQSGTGLLFRVDPATGETEQVDLGGELLEAGDGLTRDGRTLYAVQNQLDQVAVLRLDRDGRRAHVEQRVTDERLAVPTTVARSGDRLYLPNARFGVESPETTDYEVVSIPRP